MKEFSIPVKITLDGAPEQHKDLSILDCEIAVDGEDIDLDEWRDPSDTNES